MTNSSKIKFGDIIKLGRHTLMCGDSTNFSDVARLIADKKIDLILTDPPYGMKGIAQHSDGRIGQTKHYPMIRGDENQEAFLRNYEITKDLTPKKIIFGGQFFARYLPVSAGWIYWDKMTGNTDFSDGEIAYKSWGGAVKCYRHKWNGMVRAGSTQLNGRTRWHPSQKPVELFANIITDFSEPDDVILDCFGGSGTTLLACELTGRTCCIMEYETFWCEIIRERWRDNRYFDFSGVS